MTPGSEFQVLLRGYEDHIVKCVKSFKNFFSLFPKSSLKKPGYIVIMTMTSIKIENLVTPELGIKPQGDCTVETHRLCT